MAQAAPAKPMSSQIINIGSRMIFTTAGIMMVNIAILGKPSARITLLLIIAQAKNGTPIRTMVKYSVAGSFTSPLPPKRARI